MGYVPSNVFHTSNAAYQHSPEGYQHIVSGVQAHGTVSNPQIMYVPEGTSHSAPAASSGSNPMMMMVMFMLMDKDDATSATHTHTSSSLDKMLPLMMMIPLLDQHPVLVPWRRCCR